MNLLLLFLSFVDFYVKEFLQHVQMIQLLQYGIQEI